MKNHPFSLAVAVAVLRFGDELLLATRQAHQHEGNKLEFVGGKIQEGECAKQALIREVDEELGLDISTNIITKMGRIWHNYPDKSVCLHVYQVLLNDGQYHDFKDKTVGKEGQSIAFYHQSTLSPSAFPGANAPILRWLCLPDVITISHPQDYFDAPDDWLSCYLNLPVGRVLLPRTQDDTLMTAKILHQLSSQRDDMRFILSLQYLQHLDISKILAVRLTQKELFELDFSALTLPDLPIIISCHDKMSIQRANELAKIHPVMAIFLSPVLPTATHPDTPCLGWQRFGELSDISNMPVIGLGGLSPDDLLVAYRFGAVAVAGIRGFI